MSRLFLIVIVSLACNNNKPSDIHYKSVTDSLKIAQMADSMTHASLRKMLMDTTGVYLSPVKILSAKPVEEEYSSYKNVGLRFKNVSGKKISAIRFSWYGENAFGEPADMGVGIGIEDGFGGGFTDRGLGAGQTTYAEWSVLSRDVKKITLAWPTEVAFEDGTKWKLNSK